MPRVTKASPYPCFGIQSEIKAYNAIQANPALRSYAPAVVNWGINTAPNDKVAERLQIQLREADPSLTDEDLTFDLLPSVDFISTEHHGETLFDWMWDERRDSDPKRLLRLAQYFLRGLTVLAHLRHEHCAHQDAACWNFCIDGVWIDFETAVFSFAPHCRPNAVPDISVWPTFSMTVSGTDSATLLLSVVEKGPDWAAKSRFVTECIKAVVPPVFPGDKQRFHPAYLHAAERPLLSASGAVRIANNILEAELRGAVLA